jgi:nucleoside-diphosphate-sugar epimerase
MRVFVAGATGVLGRSAVPRLVEAGHEVTGVARGDAKAALVRSLGAAPVAVDLFDPSAVAAAVRGHDAVCNFATHIPGPTSMVRRSAWQQNDRLHAEASRHLVDAALASDAGVYLQHSSGFMYAAGGDAWLDESAPLDPPPHGEAIVEAEAHTARFAAAGAAGVALRFGFFYGVDAPTTRDQLRLTRLRISPVPGRADAYYPAIHTDDLGTAAVAALRAPSGPYNVVDDEPLTRAEHATVLAEALGVLRLRLPPSRIAGAVKRFDYIVRSQRVTNRRFRTATGWAPATPSARTGWPAVVAAGR